MIISLPSGRCAEMSVDQYLSMTLEDLSDLEAYGYGEEIYDPFHASVLTFGELKSPKSFNEPEESEDSEELLEDLLSITEEVKRADKEFICEDEA